MAASSAPPDARAEEIFAQARAAISSRAFPATMRYDIRISGLRNGTWTGRTYDAYEAWPEGTVDARSISEEEAADPVRPPTFCFFGLAHAERSGDASDADRSLKTIATVRAVARKYDARLAADEDIDGYPCWHLTLAPLGNPGTYRVRDLWVDKTSYQTRRLVTDGNFTGKETGAGRWTVSYVQNGSAWYLATEMSDGPAYDSTGRFDRVAVEFINVVADPHENLDFGISGSAKDIELDEPAD